MVYTINKSVAQVLAMMARLPRVSSFNLESSRGWDESLDRKKGYFESSWGIPESWDDVILQGPHLYVSTPLYKSPNRTLKNNADWSASDFEALPTDAIPATSYKPAGDRTRYDANYSQWSTGPARSQYRVAWRRMAANNGERTLITALIPPGAAHVFGIVSAGTPVSKAESLCVLAGSLSSLLVDLAVRVAAKADILITAINRLPVMIGHPLQAALVGRTLRLNCLTKAYSDLWQDLFKEEFAVDHWAGGRVRVNRIDFAAVTGKWDPGTPLRIAEDRRQALIEIDALVALMLGATADQLCTVYRTQFPVLYDRDHWDNVYDANGRLVAYEVLSVWRKKGDKITGAERTATNQSGHTYIYELPFRLLDREADMRTAYAEFERRLAAL